MKPGRDTQFADPTTALASYLDDLLHTATSAARDTDCSAAEPARTESLTAPPALTTVLAEPEVRLRPEPAVAPAPVQRSEEPPAESPPLERPLWSQKPFECLIFRVAGLQLAVPLVLLGAIHKIERKVKPIPGRPPWYMGMLPDRDQNLRIVDTAEWIMAGRVPAGARDGYRFVIRLDNSEWALACDEVAQSFTLDPDEVRWRSTRSKRPWLAGTVIKHMCALIDVGTMASLLARAESEHRLALD
ncbi:chemotaxis protein CheW [Marinobacter changyiensis]|uniref:chemotaxis protein CheW n=1 Tax=Marinobacter changyiensis TaxID=2604091 RepID=UPI001264C39D|nr:chemotaxis protein CheW [Marinobacter changyiensis]